MTYTILIWLVFLTFLTGWKVFTYKKEKQLPKNILDFKKLLPHYTKETTICPHCKSPHSVDLVIKHIPILHVEYHCKPGSISGCNYRWTTNIGENSEFSTTLHEQIDSIIKEHDALVKENEALKAKIITIETPIFKESVNYRSSPLIKELRIKL